MVLRQPSGNDEVDGPEAERAELECGPIQVRVELRRDGNVLRGQAAIVLEIDGVWKGAGRNEKALSAEACRADEGVGVMRGSAARTPRCPPSRAGTAEVGAASASITVAVPPVPVVTAVPSSSVITTLTFTVLVLALLKNS